MVKSVLPTEAKMRVYAIWCICIIVFKFSLGFEDSEVWCRRTCAIASRSDIFHSSIQVVVPGYFSDEITKVCARWDLMQNYIQLNVAVRGLCVMYCHADFFTCISIDQLLQWMLVKGNCRRLCTLHCSADTWAWMLIVVGNRRCCIMYCQANVLPPDWVFTINFARNLRILEHLRMYTWKKLNLTWYAYLIFCIGAHIFQSSGACCREGGIHSKNWSILMMRTCLVPAFISVSRFAWYFGATWGQGLARMAFPSNTFW